jgi:hypothetical protein
MLLFAGIGGAFMPLAQLLALRLFPWHCLTILMESL